ncbi:putative negative regulator of RcsB-dependent stress response [Luteimonas cucumeris]|uniref:Putative negative regulator of RcsB-dependent stress response n=1 Tax=Luteimonas cucumeris TaxID=985012 RepID=A0A562KVP1_9GAMM|nr:tetratricopeptide repeat protein [Luteimonas cucumeris]TWH99491.1 putative negative regulator of RcsB-dependent stress response [Luteimonas cucumeris]
MKTRSFAQQPLVLALTAVLSMAVMAPVYAQQDYGNVGSTSMRAQRDKRKAELNKTEDKQDGQSAAAGAPLFPNATRAQPEAKASSKALKSLQDAQELYEKQDYAAVVAKAEEIATKPDANAYEKGFAYQLAGSASADQGNDAKAAEYFQKALDSNGLDNNSHYQVMSNLAAVQFGLQQYDPALKTLDRFLAETKSTDVKYQTMRGSILASMGRNAEAAQLYKDLLAQHPDDKKILMNAVASLQQADQYDQANALLGEAYKKGQLTEAREYKALYAGYLNSDKWKEAVPVIDAGVAKGLLPQDAELAKAYMIVAQKAYAADDVKTAEAMYAKAAPIAADGEAYLNLAKVYGFQGKKAEAKAAAQKALDKGVKDPAQASSLLK